MPIISTLKDIVITGDKITRIEGVFSGTMSYLFNEFSSPNPPQKPKLFSEIVKLAKELGYTEPDPRDDLNGMDVARKVVILSRVAGQSLTLETLPVENIVPGDLRSVPDIDAFMKGLEKFDDHFESLRKEAFKNGEVLRYVGVVTEVLGKNGRSSEVRLKS